MSNEQWKINGCPHHGPALDVDGNNVVHSTWFNDTDGDHVLFYGNSAGAYKAMGFGQVDKQSAHPYVLTLKQAVYLVWKEFDGKKTDILMKTSKDAGINWSQNKVVSTTAGSSDHPMLAKNSKVVYLSWHTQNEGYRFISLSLIKLSPTSSAAEAK